MSPVLLLLIGMLVVVGGVLALRLHAFLALILGAFVVAAMTPSSGLRGYADAQVEAGKLTEAAADKLTETSAAKRVTVAFGETCGKIGVLIAMAAIIGKCLLDSGAALRIVESILALLGAARAHLAFLSSGFLLAIPVFFDTVFYLLVPIGKAMYRRTGGNYLLYILTIVAGATMAHSLVPPTPGPLFVAEELGVGLGKMIVGGLTVGFFTVGFGYFYAQWANRRWEIVPPAEEVSGDEGGVEKQMPALFWSLLPIVLPVALICWGVWRPSLLTDKTVAISIGAFAALGLLVIRLRGDRELLSKAVQSALASGAVIVLITAAGGAFGAALRQTGIASEIQHLGSGNAAGFAIPIAWGLTALVRTAQGSATVAMITAAPIAAAFVSGGSLPFDPLYLALAIGCGSKPIPWMNDSGFWIITRMTGMKEAQTLKIVTPMMSLMGVVGLLVTMLLAWLLPMGG